MKLLTLTATLLLATTPSIFAEGTVTASQLRAAYLSAKQSATVDPSAFVSDEGPGNQWWQPTDITLYKNNESVFWYGDLDIDCDGPVLDYRCSNDVQGQSELSCGDATINPAVTPFYVIPINRAGSDNPSALPADYFDYTKNGIDIGQIAAIIYNDKVIYCPFLDECGIPFVIGEASYAAAEMLGIDPDPTNGGVDSGAIFITFKGALNRLNEGEYDDHAKALEIGNACALAFVTKYGNSPILDRTILETPGAVNLVAQNRTLTISEKGPYSLSLYSLSGKQCATFAGTGTQSFDLSHLGNGVYSYALSRQGAPLCNRGQLIIGR